MIYTDVDRCRVRVNWKEWTGRSITDFSHWREGAKGKRNGRNSNEQRKWNKVYATKCEALFSLDSAQDGWIKSSLSLNMSTDVLDELSFIVAWKRVATHYEGGRQRTGHQSTSSAIHPGTCYLGRAFPNFRCKSVCKEQSTRAWSISTRDSFTKRYRKQKKTWFFPPVLAAAAEYVELSCRTWRTLASSTPIVVLGLLALHI